MSNPIRMRGDIEGLKTAIICTLAPAQIQNIDQIKKFVEAGMRIVRLNFSHIEEFTKEEKETLDRLREAKELSEQEKKDLENHEKKEKRDRKHAWNLIRLIRASEEDLGMPIGIMMDLCGPRLRTSEVSGLVEIKKGKKFIFTLDTHKGNEESCGIPREDFRHGHDFVTNVRRCFEKQKERLKELTRKKEKGRPLDEKEEEEVERLKQGMYIYVNDGRLKFRVDSVRDQGVYCTIVRGGKLETHKGVNVPYCKLELPPITLKDHDDLRWIFKMEAEETGKTSKDFVAIDYVAESFVKEAKDIHEFRGALSAAGRYIPVIAKIETPEALDNLKEIMEASDGVMVARGDLGVEDRKSVV